MSKITGVKRIVTKKNVDCLITTFVFMNGYVAKTEKYNDVDCIYLTLYFHDKKINKLITEKFEFKDLNVATDEEELQQMLDSISEYKPISPKNCRTCKKIITKVDFDTGLYTLICCERKDVNISQEDIRCTEWEYYKF